MAIDKLFPATTTKELSDIQSAMLEGKTDEAYTKGLEALTAEESIDVPDGTQEIATIVTCPDMDETISITIANELSFDGGNTWAFLNSATRTPFPWIDRDGNPNPSFSIKSTLAEKLPAGVMLRTKSIQGKQINLKIDYGF